jgi:hypothetical protein
MIDVRRRPGRLVLHLELPLGLPPGRGAPRRTLPWSARATRLEARRAERERHAELTRAACSRVPR